MENPDKEPDRSSSITHTMMHDPSDRTCSTEHVVPPVFSQLRNPYKEKFKWNLKNPKVKQMLHPPPYAELNATAIVSSKITACE